MTHRALLLERLELVAQALTPQLLSEVTLVGGSLLAVLPLSVPVRATKDVDFVLPTTRPLDWHRFIRSLEARGFRPSRDEGAPICRYEKVDPRMKLVVDVMPTDDRLGFTNRWYQAVHENRSPTKIPNLYAATPLDYLLTKIEAFKGRGAKNPLLSVDLEDIVTVCRGLSSILDQIASGVNERDLFARQFFRAFVKRADALELILAHTEGDRVSQEAAQKMFGKLRAF
jgi:hypothetical protein